jgi:hypothetical protein
VLAGVHFMKRFRPKFIDKTRFFQS